MTNEKRLSNIKAEQSVLGSILINNEAFYDVISEISADDFFDHRHKLIFEVMSSMLNKSHVPVDLLSLSSELAKRNVLITVGEEIYLAQLSTSVPSASHVGYYTTLVKEASIRRKLKEMAGDIDLIAESEDNVEDAIDTAEKKIFQIATDGVSDISTTDIEKSGEGVIKKIEYLREHRGEVNGVPSGYDELDKILGGFNKTDMIVLAARPGVGKFVSYDEAIYKVTDRGTLKVEARDIKEGDTILGNTDTTKVVGVYPQEKQTTYKVTFDDGGSLVVGDPHLWTVRGRPARIRHEDKWETMTTSELLEKGVKRPNGVNPDGSKSFRRYWEIPKMIVNGNKQEEQAYVLGAWLGDGHANKSSFSDKFDKVVPHIREIGWRVEKKNDRGNQTIYGLITFLKSKDWNYRNKLPSDILSWDIESRKQLLAGLMDTDGGIGKNNSIEFGTVKEQLAVDVLTLVRSLGGKGSIKTKDKPTYTYKGEKKIGKKFYRVIFSVPFNPFVAAKFKFDRWSKPQERYYTRFIDNIEEIEQIEGVCFKVDAENELFIAGDDMIVTHNTSLALNMIDNITKGRKKNKALFFSLEMSEDQLTGRILSSKSNVGSFKFRTGNINDQELESVREANEKLSRQKIYINDSSATTLAKMKSIARKLKRKGGLDFIVVDYLQLIIPHKDDRRNQYMAITNISKGLKQLAKELDVPVIALSQLSRDVEKRGKNAEPNLSDLRDSGSIEQDADIVLFISKVNTENDNDIRKIIVSKNRHGGTGEVFMSFNGEITTFEEIPDWQPNSESKDDDSDFEF